jgi:hypothetical protein
MYRGLGTLLFSLTDTPGFPPLPAVTQYRKGIMIPEVLPNKRAAFGGRAAACRALVWCHVLLIGARVACVSRVCRTASWGSGAGGAEGSNEGSQLAPPLVVIVFGVCAPGGVVC